MKTVGVFPASGGLGTSTYMHLLQRLPPTQIVLINRHPDRVSEATTKAGVRVRQAAYESSPEDLQAAFDGVDVLFLISYPSHVHEYRVKVQLPAIDAARRAGVRHIFYSSLGFAGGPEERSSRAVVMQAHLDTEAHLRHLAETDDEFTFTSVREGLYAQSFPIYTAFFSLQKPTSEVLIPHDGSGPGISWVSRDELGEGTAKLIAGYVKDPGTFKWVNGTVLLVGPRAWTLNETVDVLSKVAGKEVEIRQISVEEYAKLPQVLAVFGNEEKATTWATAWEAIRAGETATLTTDLQEILEREPGGFDLVVKGMAE